MGGLAGSTGGRGEVMDIGHVTWRKASWRKASYSGGNGGGCVEVGAWRKASHSGGNGGACVEVASTGQPLIAVRDSKDPGGPNLTFGSSVWGSFIQRIQGIGPNQD